MTVNCQLLPQFVPRRRPQAQPTAAPPGCDLDQHGVCLSDPPRFMSFDEPAPARVREPERAHKCCGGGAGQRPVDLPRPAVL